MFRAWGARSQDSLAMGAAAWEFEFRVLGLGLGLKV